MATVGILLRRVRALVADEPTAFVWVYPEMLAGSGYPASRGQLAWLGRKGIDSVLSLTGEPLPAAWLPGSMRYAHIPMRDHEPPEQETLASVEERIETELESGRVVLVHCQAGRGRTMCALAAYLIKGKGLRPDDALSFLRRIRPGAVEAGQEVSLKRFAASLRSADSRRDPQ